MISVLVDDDQRDIVRTYFDNNNLELNPNIYFENELREVRSFLRTNYNNKQYLLEALISNPNKTKSRDRIYVDNPKIIDDKLIYGDYVRTITTKQDRHPNSGVIYFPNNRKDKSDFRYLTPRECFLLMGFKESDYDLLISNNFESRKNTDFLSRDKLIRLAGNSIVVDVLESIFLQIYELKDILYPNGL